MNLQPKFLALNMGLLSFTMYKYTMMWKSPYRQKSQITENLK